MGDLRDSISSYTRIRLNYIAGLYSNIFDIPEVVFNKKNNADGNPKTSFGPVVRLERLQRCNPEEKQENGKVGSDPYFFHFKFFYQ